MLKRKQGRDLSAFEAISQANRIACAPFIFQAAYCMREFGIFKALEGAGRKGLSLSELIDIARADEYTVRTLVDAGLEFGLILREDDRLQATKTAWFLVNDPMTRANFDFSQDVCYRGLAFLKDAFEKGRPEGLKVLSDSPTIYPVISKLPEPARASWFAFDHFYSDQAYDQSLPVLFEREVTRVTDIGGNTGKFSMKCCAYDSDVSMTIIDLPEQCAIATENAAKAGLSGRIRTVPANLLDEKPIPNTNADVWWMSQFLDCFSPSQIVSILSRVRDVMRDDARVFILEPLIGQQPQQIGNVCLAAYSLYFTAMANGNSRFYRLEDFREFIAEAGLKLSSVRSGIGTGHTLLICEKGEGK